MEPQKTAEYPPAQELSATLLLIDCRCEPQVIPLRGNVTIGRIYDGELCGITAQSSITGRRHGEFVYDAEEGAYFYIDSNSLNCTYLNGKRLAPYNSRGSRPARLHDGDILRIDRDPSEKPHPDAVIMIYCTTTRYGENWRLFDSLRLVNITVGRGENNVIRLNDSAASRSHAVLRKSPDGWSVFNNSKNGLLINGVKITESAFMRDHDVLTIGNTTLVIFGNIILYGKPINLPQLDRY